MDMFQMRWIKILELLKTQKFTLQMCLTASSSLLITLLCILPMVTRIKQEYPVIVGDVPILMIVHMIASVLNHKQIKQFQYQMKLV